jgi:uncharacterized protein YecE (DUF72 family)
VETYILDDPEIRGRRKQKARRAWCLLRPVIEGRIALSRKIHIGTSGWHYGHWKGNFYPAGLPARKFLDYYAGRFRTAEINNTFYQVPKKKTLEEWRDAVPVDFVFAVKASRFITHMKKLKDSAQPAKLFLRKVGRLKEKLGPVLFQLPPRWRANPERLENFLEVLPRGFQWAFEFRDPDWFRDDVYSMLEKHNAAFCIYDLNRRLSPKQVTADWVYVRLHGPDGPYQGKYDTQTLAGWAGAFSAWTAEGRTVYCYFDNDQNGFAAQDALLLLDMLEEG